MVLGKFLMNLFKKICRRLPDYIFASPKSKFEKIPKVI
jgi:hypothetical protein